MQSGEHFPLVSWIALRFIQATELDTTSATYDNNGNLTTLTDTSGTTTYTWNARDQLVSLSGPGVTASFQYDAVGRRKSKTVNGTK
jgi:YD repeat-containing protein